MEGVDKKNSIFIYSGGEEINNQIWLETKVAIWSWIVKTFPLGGTLWLNL
jgi:hypothetical protein